MHPNALPQEVDFYSLGRASLRPETTPATGPSDFRSLLALGYTIEGDVKGALLCFFSREHALVQQDPSFCEELGNVIASKLVTDLYRDAGLDLMISPPRTIDAATFGRLANAAAERTTRTYEWTSPEQKDQNMTFVVWLIWERKIV